MNIKSAHFLPGSNKTLGDRYLLLDLLGDGSHGWVWRAERLRDKAIVAVKVPKQSARDDRSLAEGRDLIGIAEHPNVIKVFDMGRVPPEKEWFAIEMEYFPSESLAQKLESRSHHFGNTYQRLFTIYRQVLNAVGFLAGLDRPISHGDIKPHNILVGQDDRVKLTDFGSSALPEEIYVRTRENGGTVLYAAPEFSDCVSRKGSFEELLAGDIYSLGVLLYQLTTGRLPHDTQAQVRGHVPFPKPREVSSTICPVLETVILRCLEKQPMARYTSIEALNSDFEAATQAQTNHSSAPSVVHRDTVAEDWSNEVMRLLERGEYQRAERVAAAEYRRSRDLNALLQQLNALFREERWYDFVKVLDAADNVLAEPGLDGARIRLLGTKVFMTIRELDRAVETLNAALEFGEQGFDLRLCDASIAGMRTHYREAREKLEQLNRDYPMNPHVIRRLVQVCEQERDYDGSAGYLRVALRVMPGDTVLLKKRQRYEVLGVW